MGPTDPNNTLGNATPTHINAYFADLAEAERELLIAQGKVQAAKDAVVANGGTLPADSDDADDVVVDGDEAQLAQDEATDKADDTSEAVEADASDEAPSEPAQPGDVVQPTEVPAA